MARKKSKEALGDAAEPTDSATVGTEPFGPFDDPVVPPEAHTAEQEQMPRLPQGDGQTNPEMNGSHQGEHEGNGQPLHRERNSQEANGDLQAAPKPHPGVYTHLRPREEPQGNGQHQEQPTQHRNNLSTSNDRHKQIGLHTTQVAQAGDAVLRLIDDGNRRGLGIQMDFADPKERPSEEVKHILKAKRYGGEIVADTEPGEKGHRWDGQQSRQWRKPVSFHDPIESRLNTEAAFAEAVEQMRKEKSGQGRG